MKHIIPSSDPMHPIVQVVDIQEEKRIESEATALVELHDFIKAHPDSPVKEIARFMPPVDARAVSRAIKLLALREQRVTPAEKEAAKKAAASIEVEHKTAKWGRQ